LPAWLFSITSASPLTHAIALEAGWSAVREPKVYPRFNDRYYASFVEDDNGIRLEFMYNPPRDTVEG
jgi:hypothetical protein